MFGKLPDRGDFVRCGGGSPALDALDATIRRALGPSLPSRTGPLYRFVYNPPEGPHALAGALQLSRDRVGRSYPLVVGRPIDRRALDPAAAASWPLRWEDVFDAAAIVVHGAVGGEAHFADVTPRVAALPHATWAPGRSPAVDRHVQAAVTLPARDLFERLPGGVAQGHATLCGLIDVLQAAAVPGFGVRFALPEPAADFGRADGVSFWLAAGAHLMRARAPWPSALWSDASADQPAALVVFYGGLSAQALRPLLAGVADPNTVLALDADAGRTAKRVSAPLAALLSDPSASVADVLARLHTLV